MFKKLLAKIGIGSASVDAVLTTDQFVPGGTVEGRIEIRGGNVEQEVSAITLKLMTLAKADGEDVDIQLDHAIEAYKVADGFVLKPGDEIDIPFSFSLHPETPITVLDVKANHSFVWIETALDIEMARDPKDRDFLDIHPSPVIDHFIKAMNSKGFKMVKADVEKGFLRGDGFQSRSGCYQEMEFKPSGFGLSRIREVELSFIIDADQTHVLIELDRAFTGDGYQSLSLPNTAGYAEVEAILGRLVD